MSKSIIMSGDLSGLAPAVANSIAKEYGHHRLAWFQGLLDDLNDYFESIFGNDYQALHLTTTLQGAYDAINFNTQRHVIVKDVSNDGGLLDLDQKIAEIRKQSDDLFIAVDISLSFGVDRIFFNNKEIDAYIIAPEKSLMSIPGTVLVVIKKSSVVKLENERDGLLEKPYLLDLIKSYKIWDEKRTTPYSPSISSIIALDRSIRFINFYGGLKQHFQKHKIVAEFIRDYLWKNGFPVINQKPASNAFTICQLPENIQAQKIVDKLSENNIFIELVSNIHNTIKIGHFGYISKQSLKIFIEKFSNIVGIQNNLFTTDLNIYDDQNLVDLSHPIENAFSQRVIGLIGEDKDFVKEYLISNGIKNIIEQDVFLRAHTIILLPAYNKVIDGKLLQNIEKNGKMDVLINFSLNPKVIHHQTLEKSIQNGWLNYYSSDTKENIREDILKIVLNSVQEKLLTPGPTLFNPAVFDVMDSYKHHQSSRFKEDFFILSDKISNWMGAHNQTLILSSPSTGFMEAAISNFTGIHDRGLIISHGKFGDRWMEICQAKNREYILLRVADEEWGRAFTEVDVKYLLAKQQIKVDFICFQQNETSSGVSYNQKQIKKIVKIARQYNPNIIVIMDFVSGAFAHDINFDAAGIDAMIIGSQKGLGISSGVSFMNISDRVIQKMLTLAGYQKSWQEFKKEDIVQYVKKFENQQRVNFLNVLQMFYDFNNKIIANVPDIFHVYSALRSLRLIEDLGGRGFFIKRHARLARYVRKFLIKQLGLQILGDIRHMSNSVTLPLFPKDIDAGQVKKMLYNYYGISVSGAQSDYWKSGFFRIGHLGYVDERVINHFLRALKVVIDEYKRVI